MFESICHKDAPNINQTWNTNDPYFNLCLRQTVFTWIPCVFFIFFSSFEFYALKKIHGKDKSTGLITKFRIFLNILCIFVNFIEFIFYLEKYFTDYSYHITYFISSAMKTFTFTLAFILQFKNKKKGCSTNVVLWFFLLVNLICLIPTVSQLLSHKTSFTILGYYYNIFYIGLVFLLFIFSSISDFKTKDTKSKKENLPLLSSNEEEVFNRNPCPELNMSIPSQILFSWFTKYAILGYRRSIQLKDVFDLNEEEGSDAVIEEFERNLYQVRDGNYSILSTILKTYWFDMFLALLLLVIGCIFGILPPVLLKYLLKFVSSNEPIWHGFVISFAMFASSCVSNLAINYHHMKTYKARIKTELSITLLLYKKTLKKLKNTTTAGEVLNLTSVDVQQLVNSFNFILYSLLNPIFIIIVLWLLFNQLNYSAFGGGIVIFVAVPITYISSRFANRFQRRQMKFKDERIKHLNEAFNGIKIIKLYAWEPSFIKLITNLRINELKAYKGVAYLLSISMIQWILAPFLVTIITFAIYCYSGGIHDLDAEKIFVTITLIEFIRLPLSLLPQTISFSLFAYVSAKRIDKYLNTKELDDYISRDDNDFDVQIKDGQFGWETDDYNKTLVDNKDASSNSISITLNDINLVVRPGSLHAIIGPIGSGKSSLLNVLLGEINKFKGSVNIKKGLNIAYVAQQSWIQNLTLRDNILFGKNYNRNKYEDVIEACGLLEDLESFPAGDLTEIGEKGINLSGGQKQRVSIARACYSDADLYLFDDPLSAVDANVAKHLFNRVFSNKTGLLKNKTRLVVTNKLDILSQMDFITIMKDGKIIEQGTYEDLLKKNMQFRNLVNENVTTSSQTSDSTSIDLKSYHKNENEIEEITSRIIDAETTETGNVSFGVYKQYMKMITYFWCFLILIGFCSFQASSVLGNLWLSKWADENPPLNSGQNSSDIKNGNVLRGYLNYQFLVYSLIGVFQVLFLILANVLLIKAGLRTSKLLHSNLLNRVFRAPMAFFETNPLGRITNRFSLDMNNIDTQLPLNFNLLLNQLALLFGSFGVISFQTPYFLFLLIPMLVIYVYVQRVFITTSRQLQRLQSITRSPVYSHFSQTIQGLSTIHAFDANERFVIECKRVLFETLRCFYASIIANRWLNVILAIFGSLVILFVGFYATFNRETIDAGSVGISMAYAFTITQILTWLIRYISQVEMNIVSVERIDEYSKVKTEAEWLNEECKPLSFWPEEGTIEFKDYSTRYRDGLDAVLTDFSAKIKPKEKIGIVGRTGAGKSTITLSLFRIIEALKGKIVIDDINIADIGLHDLRSKITIIPQDPVLFSGTLRFNLDPFDAFSDHQIWEALKHSHLSDFVSNLEKGLFHEISERGENLSVGQRQLICLARALLRKSKILVLDEATAAVDLETDSLIQTTIKNEFSECTTLTVAHRIQTILDCDRVMLIDKGTVIEFDSPSNLMSDANSQFHFLAKNSGIIDSVQKQ